MGFFVKTTLLPRRRRLWTFLKPALKKKTAFPRCLATNAAVGILWGLLLNSVWLSFYMGKTFWAWTVAKAPLKLILIPVQAYLIYLTLRGLQKTDLTEHL